MRKIISIQVRPCVTAWAIAWWLATVVSTAAAQAPAQPPDGTRNYETGPLTQRDFAATAPDDNLQLAAFTTSDLHFNFAYRYQSVPGRVTATLSEMEVLAIVIPGKSWLRRTLDVRLLDHEQGHFDLTYIAALRQRIHFAKMLRGRMQDRLSAVGTDLNMAVEALRKKVAAHLQEACQTLLVDQTEYDRVTQQGLKPDTQAEQRRQQKETIQSLLAEWKPFEPKTPPAKPQNAKPAPPRKSRS